MKFFILLILVLPSLLKAEDKSFKGETEATVLAVNGNSSSETYGIKTKNTYGFSDLDNGTVFGKFIRTSSGGTETGKSWDAGLRYERIFTKDLCSGFLQHTVEHDPYNGIFVQRDSTDVGLKYIFITNDKLNWFGELGYRTSNTYNAGVNDRSDFGRLYTEVAYKFSATSTSKLWVEYLPNLKDSGKSMYNTEASLSVTMTELLSLKAAFLLNHNEDTPAPLKKDTTTLTTALVAKY
jgi:putative salt-induced outer membrane protein